MIAKVGSHFRRHDVDSLKSESWLILDNTLILTGDSEGNPGNTSWGVGQGRFTKNKGPFHWFHLYDR